LRLVIGTRPEAIKLAPVAHALADRGFKPTLIFTGQHPELDPADFGLGRYPADRLGCRGEEDPHRHVRAVTAALLPRLAPPPSLLIVQGDQDDLVSHTEVIEWASKLAHPPEVVVLPGVEHFFHGKLNELRDAVTSFAQEN